MTASAAIGPTPSSGASPLARRRGKVALVTRPTTRPVPLRTISRPRLTRALTMTAHPLVTVVAPAGYGKTTLLCDWADHDERPFAWVTLDRADNDPACLDASVAIAMERLQPTRGTGAFVLVVDDVQELHEPAAHAALAALLAGLARGATLALASRTPPPLPVARMRAQGLVTVLGPRELAMDLAETAATLALAGLELPREHLTALLEHTEGWPAALSLAAIALGDTTAGGDVSDFGGADRFVADFVRDEILDGLEPDRRRLMLESSTLEELTGPVCDHVLGRNGSAAALLELSRDHGLLIALDRCDERFRHHRLVGEMLAAELRRLKPARAAELHRRASNWYRAGGERDRAVRHAISAGDVAAAGELVWSSAVPAVSHGARSTVEEWLGRFTDAERHATPTLALASATTEFAAGQGHLAEHWAQAAVAGAPEVATGARIIRAALSRGGLTRMREEAVAASADAPDSSRGLCCLLAGTADLLAGNQVDAAPQLQEAARRAAVTAPDLHALCLTQLALPALVAEDWEEAGALVMRARAQVERYGLATYPSAALVLAASALVRAHRGRVEEAQRDLHDARELRARLTDFAAWYEVELSVVLARAAVRLSDRNGGRELLAGATRGVRTLAGAPLLEAWIEATWAQLEAADGPANARPFSLTTAELRTLGFLPTHLSFREIGERAHVSANTVKTQANAVYRKLDVSCRSDAVSRARELGLLDA